MNVYDSKKKINLKNRYQNSQYHYKKFFKYFQESRKKLLQDFIKFKKTNFKVDIRDHTYHEIKNIYLNKTLPIRKIENYYKKFEFNICLKKKYSLKEYLALTKKNTNEASYIYLGIILIKLNSINNYQKLNVILKIIDKISLNKKNFKFYDKKNFLKLLSIESKLIKKILNEK